MAKYGSMSLRLPLNMVLPAEMSKIRDSIVKISYVGGCSVRITMRPAEKGNQMNIKFENC